MLNADNSVLHCIEVADQSRSAFDARDAFERLLCQWGLAQQIVFRIRIGRRDTRTDRSISGASRHPATIVAESTVLRTQTPLNAVPGRRGIFKFRMGMGG